jgi:hypothetical protein
MAPELKGFSRFGLSSTNSTLSSSEKRKRRKQTQERKVSWEKVLLASLAALGLSNVVAASDLHRATTSFANEKSGVTGYTKRPRNSSSGQAGTDALSKPDSAEDQGAFWTPEDVGVAYDLSDPNEEQFLPIKAR